MGKTIVKVVLEQIVVEIGDDKIYAILADEATDIRGKDFMTIVICYVSCKSGEISERMIGNVLTPSTCSEYLFDIVVEVLKLVQLQVHQSRGQGYNCASNMSKHISGLSNCIKELSPKSIITTLDLNEKPVRGGRNSRTKIPSSSRRN